MLIGIPIKRNRINRAFSISPYEPSGKDLPQVCLTIAILDFVY
jgi:hypothetical protein